jgi:hypothetical protein
MVLIVKELPHFTNMEEVPNFWINISPKMESFSTMYVNFGVLSKVKLDCENRKKIEVRAEPHYFIEDHMMPQTVANTLNKMVEFCIIS